MPYLHTAAEICTARNAKLSVPSAHTGPYVNKTDELSKSPRHNELFNFSEK